MSDDFEFYNQQSSTEIDTTSTYTSYWSRVISRFTSNKLAVASLVTIIVITLLAIFAPNFNEFSYSDQVLVNRNSAPRIPLLEKFGIFDGSEKLKTTSGVITVNNYLENDIDTYYWFGSDTLGRDIWTRVWFGTRISLAIAFLVGVIDMCIGVTYGLISGYFGGVVDNIMQRFVEVVSGIPRLVVVTLLMLLLSRGFWTIVFALLLTEWVSFSRIARANTLKLKNHEFVLASRTLGASHFRIIFKGILPNIIGSIITQLMLSIPTAIFTEAFLSFVGLGIPVPMCSLGSLINDAYNSFLTHPYQIVSPIVVLGLLMLSFNMLADGLREAFDPKFK